MRYRPGRSGDTGAVSVDDEERAESEIRKRAAWLLAMLAVVAGLFVLLSLTLFKSSSGSSDPSADDTLPVATSAAPSGSSSRPAPRTSATGTSSGATGTGTSSGVVPKPSCPGNKTCAVQGDVGGAMRAINAYRAQHGRKAVPTTSSQAAQRCALTEGDTCPSSFVWVRVDDLSGSAVVKGVTGFHSSDDLLSDSARSYAVGWAYNPASKTVSCAVIRND